jgi:hypothetical protein
MARDWTSRTIGDLKKIPTVRNNNKNNSSKTHGSVKTSNHNVNLSVCCAPVKLPRLKTRDMIETKIASMLANATTYCLAASLYKLHIHRAMRVSKQIRAGKMSRSIALPKETLPPRLAATSKIGFVSRDKS